MTLVPGSQLGSYEILGLLGIGGMGEVFRARDTRLAREVAIKVIPDLFADDPDRLARFTREAQTLAALNHPHIAQIHGFEETAGVRALVMELVEGEDLSAMIARGPIPADDAVPIARQIAEALEAAHDLGIVHRDLKPANIKVRQDGTVKVLDFGLAKALGADAAGSAGDAMHSPTLTARATQLGVILGTAAYMAPEQAKGKAVDRRADIWAFGVILYEMLTGQRLFDAETIPETLADVITREPDVSVLPASTPPHVRSLVARCLVKDPKQRLRDIGEARLALGGNTLSSAAIAPVASSTSEPRSGFGRWREGAAWTLVAFLSAVATYAVWPRPQPASLVPLRFVIPLDTRGFLGGLSLALAPDGHAIVVQATWRSGDTRLHIRRLDATTFEPLPGTEGGRSPFWSPDSRSVGFAADGQLKRIDIQTSSVRTLAAAPQLFVAGAWGAGGTILFGGATAPLSRVPASGGSVTELTFDADETAQTRPVFLPDGTRFLYSSRRTDGRVRAILARLDDDSRVDMGSDISRVIWTDGEWVVYRRGEGLYAQRADFAAPGLVGDPIPIATDVDSAPWIGLRESIADTGLVAFIGEADRHRQFTWYSRRGGVPEPVGPPGEYTTFDLSPDGRRVVAALRGSESSHLWMIDAAQGTTTRLTIGDVLDVDPRWSPDGRTVLFGSMRDPARSPFRLTPGGGPPVLAWKFDGGLFALDSWSRDGRWVLYHDASVPVLLARRVDPRTGSPDGDEVVVVARALAGTIDQGAMSPDGRWVAYNSNESGRYEVFVVPFPPTGERVQVSRQGGVQPTWRADGRELYFLASDGTLMAVGVGPEGPHAAGDALALVNSRVQAPAADIEQYAPSPDGARFLVLDPAGEFRPHGVQVLSDWRAFVERQRPR